jgi:hypothetical protein
MVILGTKVLGEMGFSLDDGCKSYHADEDQIKMMNKIVGKDILRITSHQWDNVNGGYVTKSVDIKKKFITGHDCAKALVECELFVRQKKGFMDPDHCFFEGFDRIIRGGRNVDEAICWRWGS